MVALQLQGAEERRHSRTGKVAPPVEEDDAADGGGNVGEGDEFPDMSRPYDYDEIG